MTNSESLQATDVHLWVRMMYILQFW